jgi:hypothetical protein
MFNSNEPSALAEPVRFIEVPDYSKKEVVNNHHNINIVEIKDFILSLSIRFFPFLFIFLRKSD